jgi:guanosine-diphosphatase
MRRTSVSLPTKHTVAHDPHEKAARYEEPTPAGILARLRLFWMSQTQKTRWLKASAILVTVFFLFYYLSPSGVELYHGGTQSE